MLFRSLSANQTNVDMIVDNYYIIEMEDEPPYVQAILQYEKKNVKDGFKALLVIEGLIYGLIETFKDISKTDFVKDFKELTKKLEPQSVQTLLKFFESPPQTPGQIKEAMNALTGAILNDVRLVNVILALEQKYLTKSRRVVEQLTTMKGLEKIGRAHV